jgi:hypothetical protein
MAEQDIQVTVTVDTSQATTALKGVSQAAGETAKQTDKVADATKKSEVQIGQFGSALGLAGQAAGKLSPALGGIVTMAGSATGVIQGLSTAGLGPLGIALGVASTAIAAFSTQQADATAKSKQFNDQMRENTRSLSDFIAKLREQRQLQQTERRLAAGGGTVEEYEAEVARLEARRLLLRQQYGVDSFEYRTLAAGVTAQIERTYQMLQAVEAGGGVVETTIQMEDMPMLVPGTPEFAAWAQQNNRDPRTGAPLPRGRTGGGGGGRPREAPAASAEAGLYAGGLGAGPEVLSEFEIEALMQGASARTNFLEEMAAQARQTRENETNEQARQEREDYLAQLDRNRAYLEEREAQEKEAAERLVAINDTVFQALESAFSSSVNAWLDGSMSMGEAALEMVKNVAKSLASEAIIQGLKQTALGLSALAVGSPTAAGHFAAAGKWAAVGVAAGVVGAASGAFGGGGGGGGAPAAATGGPALTAGAREGAGTTVVINWGSSGLVYAADRAQLGRDISGMISEAHGRLGRGM